MILSLTPVGQGPKIVVVLLSVARANKMKLFCKVDQRVYSLAKELRRTSCAQQIPSPQLWRVRKVFLNFILLFLFLPSSLISSMPSSTSVPSLP